MKILNLNEDSRVYTSNSYLVMGTWNTVDDLNTLIDAGSDAGIIKIIDSINTGLGKKKIDQVILTHSNSDHASILPLLKEKYNPRVYAFNPYIKGVDRILNDRDRIRIGEQMFEVFHITAHSYDSICLYGTDEGILFGGDTTFPVDFDNESLRRENEPVLTRLATRNINIIYPGHGPPRSFLQQHFTVIKKNKKINNQ